MLEAYESAKAHRALLDYDDLIIKTRDLLTDSAKASAWVMFKLDGGLSHILVDEAQDTAPEQWDLILALASEFFAGDGQSDAPRSLFVVGDVKQSIYSFQRADPAVFRAVRQVIADRSAEANNALKEIPFRFSFRSAPAVLAAVDATFADAPARDGVLEDGEEKLSHRSMRPDAPGRVEIWPLVEPPADDDLDPWEAQTKPVETLPALERLADGIAGRIAAMIGRDTVPSRGRLAGPGDIMVLVRRRGPLVDALIRRLKQRGVPVAGVDRLVLGEQIAVMDLLALGHFLLLPEDDLTCATILKSPFIGFDDDDLFDLAYDRGKSSLWRRLRDRAQDSNRFAAAVAWLSDLLAQVDFLRPYEFFTRILDSICPAPAATALTGRQALEYRLGTEVEEPVEEFLAQAILYERANLPVLQGFLHWFSTGTAEIKRDLDTASGQSVRILTVHGAKGLQAPIVILPDAPSKPRTDQGPALHWLSGPRRGPSAAAPEAMIWTPSRRYEEPVAQTLRMEAVRRQEEEYRRLLYVAMTRAEDRLIVCGHLGKRPQSDTWYDLVRHGLENADGVECLPFDGGPDWTGEQLVLADTITEGAKKDATTQPAIAGDADETAAVLPAWANAPAPPEPLPPNPLAPSRPATPDPPVLSPIVTTESGADRFQRGRVVHLLLQHLPGLPAERRRTIGLTLIGHNRFAGLDEAAAAVLVDEALAVLDHADFAPLFGPGSRAEVPLTGLVEGPDAVQVVSGQVDRILVTDQEVLVVDYKTQRPAPETAADAPVAYLNQMAAYRAVLAGVFPGRPVHCALLWTDRPHLMPIDDALLERYRPAS